MMLRNLNIEFLKTFDDTMTIAYRNILKIKYNPMMMFDVLVSPILLTLLFTFVFGEAIAGNRMEYLQDVIPGMIVMATLTCSAATGTQLNADMNKGIYDRFKSLPIGRFVPLVGSLIADFPRYALAITTTMVTGFLIGWRPEGGLLWVFSGALFCIFISSAMSWIFALMGLMGLKAAAIQGLSNMIMQLLTFLSGTVVPTETLPSGLQSFARMNPVTYLVSTLRQMFTESRIGSDFTVAIILGCVIIFIFCPLTVWFYNKKV